MSNTPPNFSPQDAASVAVRTPVAYQSLEARADFLGRVYGHLGGAVAALIAIEVALFSSGVAYDVIDKIFQPRSNLGLFMMVAGFIAGSFIAVRCAFAEKRSTQYVGLSLEVVIWAVITLPLLGYAMKTDQSFDIAAAGVVTAVGFAGLTIVALNSRRDFSFLGVFVKFGIIAAIGVLVAGLFFGFNVGIWFSYAMVLLAGAKILWETQQIQQKFPEDAYVGASLMLFCSVMVMFNNILRIFLDR